MTAPEAREKPYERGILSSSPVRYGCGEGPQRRAALE